jgi:septal ring factor EnvC (AmiA/AmiB activator)
MRPMPTERSYFSDRQQLRAARRTIKQTRKELDELTEQIRASKETIANSEKLLARLDAILRGLEDKKPMKSGS